jgi:hypothetical protein
MKIYMATWMLEAEQGKSLTLVNKKERLLSFYHLIQIKEKLKKYVLTGLNP